MTREKTSYNPPHPDVLAKFPNLRDFFPFIHELQNESERGAVLICCSYLEELLGDILRSFFLDTPESKELLEGGIGAPLGTFSARAKAAYACGLITEDEFLEINRLRKIRIAFAHSRTASFKDQNITDLSANLKYGLPQDAAVMFAPFLLFQSSAVSLIANLANRPHYVSEHRVKGRNWPF